VVKLNRISLALFAFVVVCGSAKAVEVPAERAQAAEVLRYSQSDVRVDFDDRLGTPAYVRRLSGFLSGKGGVGLSVAKNAAAGLDAADPHLPVKAFLNQYHDLFGFDASSLNGADLDRDYVNTHNGVRTSVWQQKFNGLPVYGARLLANVTARGELISIGSHFVPDVANAANATLPNFAALQAQPPLSASDALRIALRHLLSAPGEVNAGAAAGPEQKQTLRGTSILQDAQAQLTWFPPAQQQLKLAWDLIFVDKASSELYRILVDVQTSSVIESRCLTDYIMSKAMAKRLTDANPPAPPAPSDTTAPVTQPATSDASPSVAPNTQTSTANAAATCAYRVWTSDSPSPFTPGWSTSNTAQPAVIARTLVTLASLNSTASPDGWVDTTYNETRGNNVDAHTDTNGDNIPDTPRPVGTGSPLTFDFTVDLAQAPSTYRPAAVTSLFYWCNFMHDKLYDLGFTEAAGNFQNNNYGRGGQGNDAVQADAQDGSGTNNANFSTPPDGSAGRMQMFLWTSTSPNRDGDFDAQIILHEYTHGLSNRLVGGGVGISSLQPQGMGEGWSDFYSLALLADPADDLQGTYPVGAYAIYGQVSDNYYRGIRRYPYAIEPGATVTTGSKNPLTFGDIKINAEVHDMGEVWCETLWEVRAKIVAKLGFDPGNQVMLQLVTDGMKLSPANPTFLQARDAILQADQVNNSGANQNEIWVAFAKRGMGYSAQAGSASSTTGVVEAFDVPGDLRITPTTSLVSTGQPGGPFSPGSQVYTLQNTAATSINWTASATQTWITLSSTSGTLSSGGTVNVTVSINSNANSLIDGNYTDTITFTNTTNGSGNQSRGVALGVARNYTMAAATFNWIDPASHTNLGLSEDSVSSVQTLPFTFNFYGQPYTQLYVGANGLIGFNSTDMYIWTNTDLPSSATPNNQIYPWWDDLSPSSGGTVRVGVSGTAPNRKYVISWVNVPWYGGIDGYTFQVLLCEGNDTIVFQYLDVKPTGTYGAGKSATIGIENSSGLVCKKYSYNGSTLLSNNQAIQFIWDNTPPSVTVNQAATQADPVCYAPVNFTVLFSEPVSDFATGDVTLAGTAGATTAVVTGSGTTYNVAVSGMTQAGLITVSVPAGVAHDGAGNANLASTSTDHTVTYTLPPTLTWTGGSLTSDNWSDDANWGGQHCSAGANLVFAGTQRLAALNDLPAATTFSSITFNAGGFSLSGAAIKLAGPVANTVGSNAIQLPLTAAVPLNISTSTGTTLLLAQTLDNGGFDLSFSNAGTCRVSAAVSGTGGLTASGTGTLTIEAAATYTGPTSVSSLLRTQCLSALQSSSAVSIAADGSIDISDGVSSFSQTLRELSGAGTLTNTAAAGATVTVSTAANQTFSGAISGNLGLTKTGSAMLTLSGTNTFTGPTSVNAGNLRVTGAQPSSNVTVSSGASLSGAGTLGDVTVSGTLAPGAASPGILHTGVLNFTSTGVLTARINGKIAGTYDQLQTAGSVSLNNCTLSATLGYTPTLGDTIALIANGGTALSGTFAGIPEGGTTNLGAKRFTVSYVGGTGHDVTLTYAGAPTLISDDFDPNTDTSIWTSNVGVANTNFVASPPLSSGNSLFFDGSIVRQATTIPVNVSVGGTVQFSLIFGSGTFPENADPGEDVVLEYSIDGGTTFTIITTCLTTAYKSWGQVTLAVPPAAQTSSTQFRWRQVTHSGAGYDHWALDNVVVSNHVPPTLSTIADQYTSVNSPTSAIPFTVGSSSVPASDLTLSAGSSNTLHVPVANIVFGGSGANRTVMITPAQDMTGRTMITVSVSDGTVASSTSFGLWIQNTNARKVVVFDDPLYVDTGNTATSESDTVQATLSALGHTVSTFTGTTDAAWSAALAGKDVVVVPEQKLGTLSSALDAAATLDLKNFVYNGKCLIVHADSSSRATGLVNAVMGWSALTLVGTSGTISKQPAATGTEFADDPATLANNSLYYAVLPASGANALNMYGTSSTYPGVAVIPYGAGLITFVGWSWTNAVPMGTLDGGWVDVFDSAVRNQSTAPYITDMANQTTNVDVPTAAIPFWIGSASTPADQLTLTVSSSNTLLIPNANVVLGGAGPARTVTVTPAPGRTGTSTITVTVTDPMAPPGKPNAASDTFGVTVMGPPRKVVVFDDPLFVRTGGTTIDESDTVQATLNSLAHTVTTFTGTTGASWSAALTGEDVILIPPLTNPLGSVMDGSATTALQNFVAGGKTLIIYPDYSSARHLPFLSSVFGFTCVSGSISSPYPKTAATAGTEFADDSATLPYNTYVTGLNVSSMSGAMTMYGTTTGSVVTLMRYGSGLVIFLGWDWKYAVPMGTTDGGWKGVLDSAVRQDPYLPGPAISSILDQFMREDTTSPPISFTISDPDTPLDNLVVTATSTNTTLVPNANLFLGGSGANRTLTIQPAANQNGSSTISVSVTDGTFTASVAFLLNVREDNTAPYLSTFSSLTIAEDASTGPIDFFVDDVETPNSALTLTGTSSLTTLVPNANIVFSGPGTHRTVTITPAPNQYGSTTITITAADDGSPDTTPLSTVRTFTLTVSSDNTAPTLSVYSSVSTPVGVPAGPLPIRLNDKETPLDALTLTATSNNSTLLPASGITLGGSGANRWISLAPAAGQSGSATITLTVTDDGSPDGGAGLSTSTTLLLTVNSYSYDLGPTFRITSLSTSGSAIVDRAAVTGTTPGALAVSSTQVFSTGATATGRFSRSTLAGGASIGRLDEGLVSNVRNGQVYSLAFNGTPIGSTGGSINNLIAVDGATGALTGTVINLSSTINAPSSANPGVFSGYDRIVIHNGTRVYNIALTSGTVTDLGAMSVPTHNAAKRWAYWGVAEYYGGAIYLDYVYSSAYIYRSRVPDGSMYLITSFTNLGDMAAFSFCTANNRWYFQHSGASQFGGTTGSEILGYATAAWDQPNQSPRLGPLPSSVSIPENTVLGPVSFFVTDPETPSNLIVWATSSNTTVIPNSGIVIAGSAGTRTLTVTPAANQLGSATITLYVSDGTASTSSTMTVTVTDPNTAPTLSTISDVLTPVGITAGPISFTVTDGQTPSANLTITACSSNTQLIPDENIVLGGAGTARTISLTPANGLTGKTTITVTVNDDGAPAVLPHSASKTFTVYVGLGVVYMRSTFGQPWSVSTNETAMDRVFGAGRWQDLRYETVNVVSLLSDTTRFIFMEGGQTTATELKAFLDANLPRLEQWIQNGGTLLLLSAPQEGSSFALGFDAGLIYPDNTTSAAAVATAHPIFNGPFLPASTTLAGTVGYGSVSSTNFSAIMTNTVTGRSVLAERTYGAGRIVLGGLAVDSLHTPQPHAANLRANTIAYAAAPVRTFQICGLPETTHPGATESLYVSAVDLLGNIDSTYRGTVHFTSSDAAAILPADYTFTAADNGQHVFVASLMTLGSQTLTVSDIVSTPTISCTQHIVVLPNTRPQLSAVSVTSPILEGDIALLTGKIADPDDGQSFTLSVNWGNGTQITTLPAGTTYFSLQRQYIDNLTTTIALTLTDSGGSATTANVGIQVQNVAPTAAIQDAPASSPEGSLIQVSSLFYDPGVADTFSYSWTVTKNGTTYGVGTSSDFIFTPDDNGTYVINLDVTDKDGGVGHAAAKTIAVWNVAPSAAIVGAPASTSEGMPISLSSSVIDPGSADTFSYAWLAKKNGVNYATGASASFTFTPDDNGSYAVFLTVQDKDGAAALAPSVEITVLNARPSVAIAGAPATANEGDSIALTSIVTDPGVNDALAYEWLVTWNGLAYKCGSSPAFNFVAVDDGTYVVSLSVVDKDGSVGTATPRTVIVSNVAPAVAIVGAPGSSPEGTAIPLTSTVNDPGTADTLTYSWVVLKDGLSYANGAGSSFTFTPGNAGTYVVSLSVDDGDAGRGTDTRSIAVTNVAPVCLITGAPASASEGTPIVLGSTIVHPGTDTVANSWLIMKDGVKQAAFADTAQVSFVPNDNGSYVVTLTAQDSNGGYATNQKTILVANAAPVVTLTGRPSTAVPEGTPITVSSSVTDPGKLDSRVYAWTISKDGVFYGDGNGPAITFVPNDNGTYTLALTVTDKDGGSGTAQTEISVFNVIPKVTIIGLANDQVLSGKPLDLTCAVTDPGTADTFTYLWSVMRNGQPVAAGNAPAFSFTPSVEGKYQISLLVIDDDGGCGSDTLSCSVAALGIQSAPTASPNPAVTLQTVTFACAATENGTITWSWDFGDGTKDASNHSSVTHAYAQAGTYTVTVTATNASGVSSQMQLAMVVGLAAEPGGAAVDTDGDGVSDDLEQALGTDPHDPASSPATNTTPLSLTVQKPSIKLNFVKYNSDSIAFSAGLPIPAGFNPNGQALTVDIGGVTQVFTLDAKGNAKAGSGAAKLKFKKSKSSVPEQVALLSVKLTKSQFSARLEDEGLTAAAPSGTCRVTFTIVFEHLLYQVAQTMSYTNLKGTSGTAK
jgi:autotransporter-associated beta strand protein